MKRNIQLLTTIGLCALFGASLLFADTVKLKNGDTLTGKILGKADGKVKFKGTLFGELTLNESDIADYSIGDNAPPAPSSGTPVAGVETGSATSTNKSTFAGQKDAPAKAAWTRSITFGGNYLTPTFTQGQISGAPAGTTGAALGLPGRVIGVQASANFLRSTQTDVQGLDLTYAYTDYEPAGKQTDNYSAAFIWNHKINDRYYTVSRTSYSVDTIKNIDYSAIQLLGVGYKIIDTQQTKFDFVPGVVLMQENKGNAFDDEFQFGGGFLENYVYYFSAAASFEQRLLYRQSFTESDLYAIDAYVGFKGMLSEKLGLTVGLSYTYDSSLGPVSFPFGGGTVTLNAQKKDQLTLKSGVQYKF
ncbi:DUF481 domain-containing protein [Opitutaceae bacterium]|nr:DUF481 domain-containing protein [Opitutaceae bacterium]MDB4474225.1 DUF481 domain-containing protein [Opitutaceae bacterium]